MPGHRVIENDWITLADGTRLAARIWMPDGPGPFPAVLEYLPYRKRNGTAPRDESTYPVFAEAGIAGVRVDIRGSGESDGVIDGEYTPRELSDGCEVIDWIARQPWSNGRGRDDGHLLGRLQRPADRRAEAAGAEGGHLDRLDRRPLQRRHPLQERLPPVGAAVLGRDDARLPVAAARPGDRRRPLAGHVAGAARGRALPARGVAVAPAPRRLLAPRLDLRGLRRLRRAGARHRRLGRRLPQHAVQGSRGRWAERQGGGRPVDPQVPALRLAEAALGLPRRGDPLVEPLAARRGQRRRRRAADARLHPRRPAARRMARARPRLLGRRRCLGSADRPCLPDRRRRPARRWRRAGDRRGDRPFAAGHRHRLGRVVHPQARRRDGRRPASRRRGLADLRHRAAGRGQPCSSASPSSTSRSPAPRRSRTSSPGSSTSIRTARRPASSLGMLNLAHRDGNAEPGAAGPRRARSACA